MSQENLEAVRGITDAVNQGDREAAGAVIHADVEWHTRAGPILGVEAVSGRDEVIRFLFEQLPEGIEGFRVTIGELRELPGGEVLVGAHYDGRGVTSGADVEMDATQIYRFDEGRVVFFRDFATRSEALEAAGLRNSAMSRENVEIIREAVAEFRTTRKLSPRVAPDFVWDMSNFAEWPGQDEFHGRDEFDDFFTSWTEAYEDWDQEIEQVLDARAGRVVALMRQRGRLPGGDSWVELAFGVVYTVEEGRILRGQVYGTPRAALEAAGLSE